MSRDQAISQEKQRSGPQNRVPWQWRYWYEFSRRVVAIAMMILFRTRHYGLSNVTFPGGALLVANHQSFVDPMAIGCAVPEKMNFLARKTLFKFKPFGRLLDSIDIIPLNQEGLGFEGIKETIKRLKNGEKVLIFPEGARCWDGEIMPFKKGVTELAVRTKVPIIPVAIEGAHECWGRDQKPTFFPDNNGAIRIIYGEPIPYSQASQMTEDELNEFVEQKVHSLYNFLRSQRHLVR